MYGINSIPNFSKSSLGYSHRFVTPLFTNAVAAQVNEETASQTRPLVQESSTELEIENEVESGSETTAPDANVEEVQESQYSEFGMYQLELVSNKLDWLRIQIPQLNDELIELIHSDPGPKDGVINNPDDARKAVR